MEEKTKSPKGKAARAALPSAFSLFRPSIEALKVNPGTVIWLMLTPMLASVPFFMILIGLAAALASSTAHYGRGSGSAIIFSAIVLLLYVALVVLGIFVAIGVTISTLKSADGKKVSFFESLKAAKHFFWKYVGLCICIGLIVLAGLIVLVVPGIFFLKRYFLAPYYLVDRDVSINKALKQSAEDTNKTGGLWGLLGMSVLISALSLIPLVGWIGSFIAGILYVCAPAIRYREVLRAAQER
jgi:hypothetical protein